MTIASQTSRISYTGDGVTTAFSVPFYFAVNADIVVNLRDAGGNVTLQVLGTNYALTGATLSAGGTCTFTVAPASGLSIIIYRDPAMAQTTSYNNNDPFPAKSHELALDKLTTISQRAKDLVNRAVHLTDGDSAATMTLPAIEARKGKIFGFSAVDGTPVVSNNTVQTLDSVLSGALLTGTGLNGMVIVSTIAALRALTPIAGQVVFVQGTSAMADGGQAVYSWNASSTATADNVIFVQPNAGGVGRWVRELYSGSLIVASRTLLKALDTTSNTLAYLSEAGREGWFQWVTGDFSSWVTADTLEGVYVKATAIASTVGAWRRVAFAYGTVHVRWFGAKPDAQYVGRGGGFGTLGIWYSDSGFTTGATDNTAAIQAAVNFVPLNGGTVVIQDGWEIQFDGGGYLISGTITTAARRVQFRGVGTAGPYGSNICVQAGNQDWFTATYDSVSFYDLTFRGPSAGTGNAIVLGTGTLQANRCFSGRIMNCYFVGVGAACVKLVNAEDFHINACTMEICQYGILGVMCDQLKVVNSTFYGCTVAGVYGIQGSDWNVIGNNFYLCAHGVGAGIPGKGGFVWDATTAIIQSRDIVVANNTFDQNNIDVALAGQTGAPAANTGPNFFSILGNKSQFADGQSIYVSGPSSVHIANNTIVAANNSAYATTAAIEIVSSDNCFVNNNTNYIASSANKVDYGLRIGAGVLTCRIGNGNKFTGNSGAMTITSMASVEFERVPAFASGTLHGGNAVYDGEVAIDTTNNRLCYWSNGLRYYLAGTSF